jgi:LysM repeat protein
MDTGLPSRAPQSDHLDHDRSWCIEPTLSRRRSPRRRRRSQAPRRGVALAIAVCLGPGCWIASSSDVVAAAPQTCTADGASHHVGDGDTWFGIAVEAEVSMSALLAANGADATDVIHPGDVLCLPSGATPTSGATASPGAACNTSTATYAVARGDSWFQIARRAGVSMRELLDANGADVDDTLQPDERLCLPPGARLERDVNAVVPLEALPVQGPCWYGNTWHAPRGAGRKHEGVDLITESGNYVYAVADGVLTKRAWDQPGLRAGNAWWLTTADGTYFFYAHLSDFAPGLRVGSRVRAGEIIGFVGNTGNSATAHLHFEIHPFGGEAINPYPSVRAAGGCRSGAGYTQPNGWTPD